MSDLFQKISRVIRAMRSRPSQDKNELVERRRAPRLICSTQVLWEVGREQGEAELREISSTGLKLRTDRAILAGKHIRVRPMPGVEVASVTIDVAIGTVVYSRARQGRFEVGVELVNPERISRFAWIGKLSRGDCTLPSAAEPAAAAPGVSGLRLVDNGGDSNEREQDLIRSRFIRLDEEKNSKK